MDHSDTLISAERVARLLGVSARRVRAIPPAQLPYVQLEARGKRAYRERDVAELRERRTIRQ